jgi:hypothetical protein
LLTGAGLVPPDSFHAQRPRLRADHDIRCGHTREPGRGRLTQRRVARKARKVASSTGQDTLCELRRTCGLRGLCVHV